MAELVSLSMQHIVLPDLASHCADVAGIDYRRRVRFMVKVEYAGRAMLCLMQSIVIFQVSRQYHAYS